MVAGNQFKEGGSSPLARGTRKIYPTQYDQQRFIPAGAGNTPPAAYRRRQLPVHPRWRGEHWFGPRGLMPARGSSPLARGTLFHQVCMKRDGRFIPAGAGNTSGAACAVLSASVHPRWRGEHAYRQVQGNEDAGSSPLARGTHLQLSLGNLQIRFIPAGAGNTNWSREVQRFSSVHPRWRGEHRLGQTLPPLSHGSSPLARGTPH